VNTARQRSLSRLLRGMFTLLLLAGGICLTCQFFSVAFSSGRSNPPPHHAEPPRLVRLSAARAVVPAEVNWRVSQEFRIHNARQSPVTIRQLRSSCGCNKATADRQVIEPGETAVLTLNVNLTGRTGVLRVACLVDTEGGDSWECLFEITLPS